ncbi:hypothetical protein DAI22_01g170150 [Oryza sativa Japonica Group]|nr:hypothetical protein DAI22_01g170150 [Oryza sativa Japonica Group]
MAPVKVFGPAKSTAVARVLVCLEEVGAEYELVGIHIPAGEQKSPAHLARNVRNAIFPLHSRANSKLLCS